MGPLPRLAFALAEMTRSRALRACERVEDEELFSLHGAEHCYAYTVSGGLLFARQGVTDHVTLDRSDLRLLYRAGNVTLTHNHLEAISFSLFDVRFAARHRLAEIRAVGSDAHGRRWRYRMLRPIFGWPAPQVIEPAVADAAARVEQEYGRDLVAGHVTLDFAEFNGNHDIWVHAARRLGLPYRREVLE